MPPVKENGATKRRRRAEYDAALLIKLPTALLEKIDEIARRRGVSRAGWIRFVVSRELENEQ